MPLCPDGLNANGDFSRVPGFRPVFRFQIGTNDAEIVGVTTESRKELADLDAALPVWFEREWRLQQRAGLALGLEISGGRGLPVVFIEHRLRVEGIDLRRAAIEEQEDDVFGLGGKMRRLWSQRIQVAGGGRAER